MKPLKGMLEPFSEQGTEGVLWCLYESRDSGKTGYDALHVLRNGDILTVYEVDGVTIRWQGVVDLNFQTNRVPNPSQPQHSYQAVFHMVVHGLQRGVAPMAWALMFLESLPAEVKPIAPEQSA